MTERSELDTKLKSEAVAAHDNWFYDAVADLMAAGVARDRISVHFRANLRTIVMVDGEKRLEFTPPDQ